MPRMGANLMESLGDSIVKYLTIIGKKNIINSIDSTASVALGFFFFFIYKN